MHLPRLTRTRAAAIASTIICSSVLLATPAAHADTRTGDVTVTIPSKIVINGGKVPVTVTGSTLYGSLDKTWVNLYNGTSLQALDYIHPNSSTSIDQGTMTPGTIVGKADLVVTDCDVYSTDSCHFDRDDDYVEYVNGLTFHDSAPATAKYGSKVTLTAERVGKKVIWTATVQRYSADPEWTAWSGATVTIGTKALTSNGRGIAVWTEQTSAQHHYGASVAETDQVWGSSALATTPKKKIQVTQSSTAARMAAELTDGVPSIRKARVLTKSNDPNHLLGTRNGYTSAVVLYDRRTSCSDGPGADCGATVEKFSSGAKAIARKKHIQHLLKKYPFLGTERDTVHGRFLLRVSGDLSSSAAKQYQTVFTRAF